MSQENENGQRTFTMAIDDGFVDMTKSIQKHFNLTSRRAVILKAVEVLNVIIESEVKIISEDGKTEIIIL